MTRARVILRSQISEKLVETTVARYFGRITPDEFSIPFDLVPADEQTTGADHKFDSGVLIYLQYKKSDGLIQGRSKVASAGPSSRIRQFRHKEGLSDSPHSLFFPLRKKAKTATDFQHNILLKHDAWPIARSMYVAPLHLTKSEYDSAFFSGAIKLLDPFYYFLSRRIVDSITNTSYSMSAVPFLRAHISIIPHRIVKTSNHFYSFGVGGGDVAFHSDGARVPDSYFDLFSESLAKCEDFLLTGEAKGVEAMGEFVRAMAAPHGLDLERFSEPLKQILYYGSWLREEFQIRQYIMTLTPKKRHA